MFQARMISGPGLSGCWIGGKDQGVWDEWAKECACPPGTKLEGGLCVSEPSWLDDFRNIFTSPATPTPQTPIPPQPAVPVVTNPGTTTGTQTPAPSPGTTVTTTTPLGPGAFFAPGWYKTPMGLGLIAIGAFVGYKLYQRRAQPKAA